MAEKSLNEMLARAERLARQTESAADASPTLTPRVGASLEQVLLRSQNLIGQASDGAAECRPTRPLGRRAAVSALDGTETCGDDRPPLTDLEQFLRSQKEKMLSDLIDESLRTSLEDAERMHWQEVVRDWQRHKQKLYSTLPNLDLSQPAPVAADANKYDYTNAVSRSSLNDVEMVFAKEMAEITDKQLQFESKPDLVAVFLDAAKQLRNQELVELWRQTQAVLKVAAQPSGDLLRGRASAAHCVALIDASSSYLETQFKEHMQMVVHGNLTAARQGGVPGTTSLVSAFLSVRPPVAGREDGVIGGKLPIWSVVYYCLRAGDAAAALETAASSGPNLTDVASALREISSRKNAQLSPDMENKMRIEYRRSVRGSSDPFQKAVYCLLAPCDTLAEHSEVADKLEDWLWMRLRQARFHESQRLAAGASAGVGAPDRRHSAEHAGLASLQRLVSEHYGERHFAGGQSALLYWTALWLTGQLEAALDYLFRQTDAAQRCHAVHMAIAAYDAAVLLQPADTRANLCSVETGEPPSVRRLNFARLIVQYTAKFEASDPREAINYLYLLRKFKSHTGENLFALSVSRLTQLTKEYEMFFGTIAPDGTRKHGLLHKFDLDDNELISFVASQTESGGDLDNAVRLYDLAGEHGKVFSLLSNSLSQVASLPRAFGSERERVCELAVRVAARYRQCGYDADASVAATFFLLLDVCTYFDLFHERQHAPAIDVVDKLELIPRRPEDVDACVHCFYMVPEEMRRLLAPLFVSYVEMVCELHERANVAKPLLGERVALHQQTLAELKARASALIQYAGMIPFRLAADCVSRLMQLESTLH